LYGAKLSYKMKRNSLFQCLLIFVLILGIVMSSHAWSHAMFLTIFRAQSGHYRRTKNRYLGFLVKREMDQRRSVLQPRNRAPPDIAMYFA